MSTTTYIALKNKLTAFANAHLQIKRIGFDYDEQSEDFYVAADSFPAVFVTLTNVSSGENVARFTVNIECLDLITQNRSNINFITSDCELILRDFYIYFRDGNETSIDVINEPATTPLNNVKLDYCAGAEMSIEFEVDTYTLCAIPMGEVSGPIDNCEPVEIYENDILVDTVASGGEYRYETSCEDVAYTVKYEDDTIIEQGSEPSGGSILVVVPNCPAPEPCDDGTVNVQKSDATLISAVNVTSGGTSNYQVSDSTVNVNASLLANVKATDTLNISVVDSTDTPVAVTLSGGNKITIPSLPCVIPTPTPYDGALPTKSGQTTSYFTGDDGDLERGNGSTFFALTNNNPFGHTRRFTGTTGGYHNGTTWVDVNGTPTTEALAFPNDWVLDWQGFDRDNEIVIGYGKTPSAASANYSASMGSQPFTFGGLSNSYFVNIGELMPLLNFQTMGTGNMMNYPPFNYVVTGANATRVGTTTNDGTNKVILTNTGNIGTVGVNTSTIFWITRRFTLTELGL